MALSSQKINVSTTPSVFQIYHSYEEDLNQYPPAGFQIRVLATVLDGLIYAVINRLFDFLMSGTYEFLRSKNSSAYLAVSILISLILSGYYYAWPVSEWGFTPGKKLLGLKVISTLGESKLTFWQAFYRCTFGYFISLCFFSIGFLRVLWRKDKLALHDELFHTRVIICKK